MNARKRATLGVCSDLSIIAQGSQTKERVEEGGRGSNGAQLYILTRGVEVESVLIRQTKA